MCQSVRKRLGKETEYKRLFTNIEATRMQHKATTVCVTHPGRVLPCTTLLSTSSQKSKIHPQMTETNFKTKSFLTSVSATSNIGASARVPWKRGTQSTHRTGTLWLSFFFSFCFSATKSPLTEQWGYLAACRSILQYACVVNLIGIFKPNEWIHSSSTCLGNYWKRFKEKYYRFLSS